MSKLSELRNELCLHDWASAVFGNFGLVNFKPEACPAGARGRRLKVQGISGMKSKGLNQDTSS
jgi:hypothetical protein